MKRQNLVILSGQLVSYERADVSLDGTVIPAILAVLATDHVDYGGHHSVVFTGRLAVEVLAFREASEEDPLELTVDGWLRSGERTAVVVDRVIFHVSRDARQRAGALLRQSKLGPPPRKAGGAQSVIEWPLPSQPQREGEASESEV